MQTKYQVKWAADAVIASANWSDAASPVTFTYIPARSAERQIEPHCCDVACFGHNPAVALRSALEIIAQEDDADMELVDAAIASMATADDRQH